MSERFPSARLTRVARTRPFRQKEKLILELLSVRTQTCWDSPAGWTLLQLPLHCFTFNTLILLRSSPENQQQLEQPEPSEQRSSYLTVDLSSVNDSCVFRLIYTQTESKTSRSIRTFNTGSVTRTHQRGPDANSFPDPSLWVNRWNTLNRFCSQVLSWFENSVLTELDNLSSVLLLTESKKTKFQNK